VRLLMWAGPLPESTSQRRQRIVSRSPPGPSVIDYVSVAQVSQMFPGTRVSNIKAHLRR
jgi:hypothetical protein